MAKEITSRTSTPSAVARQLRQESGFGCAVCGNPIIEYHHIIRWEVEQHFRPEDMVAFCPNHHYEADSMTEAQEREYKADPINIKRGLTDGYLRLNTDNLLIRMGSNFLKSTFYGNVLTVDKELLLGMKLDVNKRLSISARLFDETDSLVAVIDENEWVFDNGNLWDFEFKFNNLIIRKKSRDISLNLDATENPIRIQGKFWRKGQLFNVTPSTLTSSGYTNLIMTECMIGGLNIDTIQKSIQIEAG